MKRLLTLALLLLVFLGCKKTQLSNMDLKCPTTSRNGDDTQVIGRWKLVQGETVFMSQKKEDYSCDEIIYEFQSDGTLIISSNITEYIGGDPGHYRYKFLKSRLYEGIEERYTLEINQSSVACGITNGVMTLNNSPVDGPILHLVRL